MEEDLNLDRCAFRIVEYCWYNRARFPNVKDISKVTKISPRTVSRIAYAHNLPNRNLISKYATDKKSAQARAKV